MITDFYLEILQRYCNIFIWTTLGMPGQVHQVWHYQLVEKFDVYLHKKWTSSLTSFLKYCKDLAKLLFWVLCARLAHQNRKFDFYLYAKINFTPPFFLKILQRHCKFILGDAWLWSVETILPACRKLWCVSSCIKLNLSLASLLKYC